MSFYGMEAYTPEIARRHQVNVYGCLEYVVLNNRGDIVSKGTIPNTFTDWGKQQLALLCGFSTGGYYIERMRVKKDAAWTTLTVSNSRTADTVTIVGQGSIAGPGTIWIVACASTLTGATQIHNSIDCTIGLSSSMYASLTVKIWFTGLNGAGEAVTASRLGHIQDSADAPIGSISYDLDGTPTTVASTNSASNNTLTVRNQTALTTPGGYTNFGAVTTTGWDYHAFSGASVQIGSNQELYVYEQYVYG